MGCCGGWSSTTSISLHAKEKENCTFSKLETWSLRKTYQFVFNPWHSISMAILTISISLKYTPLLVCSYNVEGIFLWCNHTLLTHVYHMPIVIIYPFIYLLAASMFFTSFVNIVYYSLHSISSVADLVWREYFARIKSIVLH